MNRIALLVTTLTLSVVLTACGPSATATIAEPAAQPTNTEAVEPKSTEAPSPTTEPTSTLEPSPITEPTSTEALPPTVEPPTVAPAPTTAVTMKEITLYCPDCAEIGMDVNVWDKPGVLADGIMAVGRFPHGTTCTQVGEQGEFVMVNCQGTVGWVKNTLIR